MIEHNSAVSSVLDSSEGSVAIVLADSGALSIESSRMGDQASYLYLLQKDGADAGNKRYIASSSDRLELESYRLKLLQLRKTYTPPKKGK